MIIGTPNAMQAAALWQDVTDFLYRLRLAELQVAAEKPVELGALSVVELGDLEQSDAGKMA
jgi:hypothetical protein